MNELTDAQCNEFRRHNGDFNSMVRAIFTAGCAQRQAGQEPVAWQYTEGSSVIPYMRGHTPEPKDKWIALYTAPPPAQMPLTELQINDLVNRLGTYAGDYEDAIVRAAEKHHGIGKARA